jgi:uncharacterized membrane protein YeiH
MMNLVFSAFRLSPVKKPSALQSNAKIIFQTRNISSHFLSRPNVSRHLQRSPLRYQKHFLTEKRPHGALLLQRMGLSSSAKSAQVAESVHPDGLTRWPTLSSPNGVLRGIDWFGTIAFASSATVTAGECGMDLLGCTIVGTITAIGGGTLRDLFLGSTPVFWMVETEYIFLCLITSVLTFFGWKQLDGILTQDDPILFWADTIGLGAFCVIGAQNGIRRGMAPVICVICGLLTATFGGVTRDTLCKRPTRILHAHAETYGITAVGGATAYMAARALKFSPAVRIYSGMATCVALRYVARRDGKRLPTYKNIES